MVISSRLLVRSTARAMPLTAPHPIACIFSNTVAHCILTACCSFLNSKDVPFNVRGSHPNTLTRSDPFENRGVISPTFWLGGFGWDLILWLFTVQLWLYTEDKHQDTSEVIGSH